MKIAILSVSNKGKLLANKLYDKLNDDSTVIKVNHFHKNIKKNILKSFDGYDAIIGIMASGILIRNIAPIIKSKITDPAILCIDDNGNFVISLLSGHLGGANSLAVKISDLLNATPVITTSSDVNNKLGVDVICKDLYFKILNPENIVYINKAIINDETIVFKINPNSNFNFLKKYIENNTLEIHLSFEYSKLIPINQIEVLYKSHSLFLEKQNLIVGIGCKKNKPKEEIKTAIFNALNELNLNFSRIDKIASAEIKKEEKGILDISSELNVDVDFVNLDKLRLFESPDISKSEFVKSKFGIDNVCESSALIVAGFNSKLIYKKTVFNGVTVAIAISK